MPHDSEYRSEAALELEMERVFARSWQLAGDLEALSAPGSYVTRGVVGESIVLTRDAAGALYALANVCRHRGAPVAEGCGATDALTCPYHGWRYGLDGRGAYADLVRLPLELIGPLVFVRVDGHEGVAPPFGDLAKLAQPYSGLVAARRLSWMVEANWKLVVENFCECLHCAMVHPQTLATRVDLDAYRVEPRGDHAVHHIRSVAASRLADTAVAERSDERATFWLWPNSAMSLLPAHLVTLHVCPVAPDRSLVERIVYGAPDDEADAIAAYLEAVMVEDIRIVEAVQRNVGSRYFEPGPLVAGREDGVAHFRELLDRALSG